MNVNHQTLQERLRKLRGNLSQAAFAKSCGITQQSYTRYESGQNIPGTTALSKIAQHANVSIQWLLTGAEESKPKPPPAQPAPLPSNKCVECATLIQTNASLTQMVVDLQRQLAVALRPSIPPPPSAPPTASVPIFSPRPVPSPVTTRSRSLSVSASSR